MLILFVYFQKGVKIASISKFLSFYFVDKDYHRYLQSIDKHITNIMIELRKANALT